MKPGNIFALSLVVAAAGQCEDFSLVNGKKWHDDGGTKYNCDWYGKKGRCDKSGHKYAFEGMTAQEACCSCGGGSCESPDFSWTHSKYGDNCEEYISGGSKKYNCESEARSACCTCRDTETTETAEEGDDGATASKAACVDQTVDGASWHDSYGETYDCSYYGKKDSRCTKEGDKYPWMNIDALQACCVCGGGEQAAAGTCSDFPGQQGAIWSDSGGDKYNCDYYSQKNRCEKEGSKYFDEAGVSAVEACCVCGGGATGGSVEDVNVDKTPKPDEGDDIDFEYLAGVKFFNKKHLQGDFILYWNANTQTHSITMGLLSPPGADGWIAVGFSPEGYMAGSDAVVARFDDDDQAVIEDKFLRNQSPSGIMAANRQDLSNQILVREGPRMALVVTRPWVPSAGGVEVRASSSFVNVIYSHGKVSKACGPTKMCNHEAYDRFVAEMALTAPSGMSVYNLNRGTYNEPCDGPAKLECQEGLYCYHENAFDLDVWDVNYDVYGTCQNPNEEEDETKEYDDEQLIYANDGGFEEKKYLRGGFVLLWTLDKGSEPGSYGPDDSITMSLVSTAPDKQGWISFGFSPNGEMKGSDVILGWSDGPDNTHIGDYFLSAQISNKNVEADKQNLVNARVLQKNGQTAIQFERKLTPADSVQVLEGLVHVIYGSGPTPEEGDKEYIPYHRFRRATDIEFVPIAEELRDANAVGLRQICGGSTSISCKSTLVCNLFDQEMLDRMSSMRRGRGNSTNSSGSGWNSSVARNTSGFTSQSSGWGRGGSTNSNRSSSWAQMMSNVSDLVGKGMCITDADVSRYSAWGDTYAAAAVETIRDASYEFFVKLRWGFDLYWDLLDADGEVISKAGGDFSSAVSIKMALIASIGPGWLGLGMGTEGQMLGANAVIGWKDNGNDDNTRINEYYLENKLPWEIKPIDVYDKPGMEITNMEIITQGHESALIIERPLIPSNGMAPILPGKTPVIYAVGSVPKLTDDYFGYHRFREVNSVEFIPLSQ